MKSKPTDARADGLAVFQTAADFRAALARFHRQTAAVCEKQGLTIDQYVVLLMIKGAPSGEQTATITELADRLKLARNSVAERVGRLEKVGLVTRYVSPVDQRVTDVRLTNKGDRLVTKAFWAVGASERVDVTASAANRVAEGALKRSNEGKRTRGQRITA